jgi:hypothetical protein
MWLLLSGLLMLAMTAGMAETKVELNGRPLAMSVEPIQVVGRTMVPMRSIFEALGARVQWTEATQTVLATRDTTRVQLTIGELTALVNDHSVPLDVPAMMYRGSTMVPLRFVSEAMGADVRWSGADQKVSIFTSDTPYANIGTWNPYQASNLQTIAIPLGTVIPVSLDQSLSSATNKVGDAFSVTVKSAKDGDAEFPLGTQFIGRVVDVQKTGSGQPGILDLQFRQARLPAGSIVTIDGSLISLDDKSVTRSADGRLVTTVKPTKDNRLQMIGIGVGAGLLIGKLLDQNLIIGGLLGGAAGYLYNEYTKDKVPPTDVVVAPGTIFGVRMDRDVRYGAPQTYVAARDEYGLAH